MALLGEFLYVVVHDKSSHGRKAARVILESSRKSRTCRLSVELAAQEVCCCGSVVIIENAPWRATYCLSFIP